MLKNKATHWGEVASWYDDMIGQNGSEFHQEVIFPALLKLINPDRKGLAGKKILDIGCGQGVLCRQLATMGGEVTGIDYAEKMIDLAKKRSKESDNCHYFVADATKLMDDKGDLLPFLQAKNYDFVTIVLAIQNIAYLSPIWKAVHRLLKTNGRLFIVMMHPSFRIPQRSDWQWNEQKNRQERVLWTYLSSQNIEIRTNPGKEAIGETSTTTTHFHRPLQAYINTLGNNNLLIEHIDELVSHKKEQTGVKSVALDIARGEFPMFLLLQARKIDI